MSSFTFVRTEKTSSPPHLCGLLEKDSACVLQAGFLHVLKELQEPGVEVVFWSSGLSSHSTGHSGVARHGSEVRALMFTWGSRLVE